ncbi:nuclear transport factor 2 family protein [Pseudoduganella sp. UC29_106]|uniref:nuclear transport factor 2 family protein n=1 Tax=Pseudoduganella sp. UC29_106 TaxID=3374553 RepID=UPI00375812B9
MIKEMMKEMLLAIRSELPPAQVEAAVRAYLHSWRSGDSAARASLFAEDAVLEDPVGAEPIVGKAALQAFWARAEGPHAKFEAELVRLAVCGDEAVAAFNLRVEYAGAGSATLRIIDNFQFDANGKIRRLRAFWDAHSVE